MFLKGEDMTTDAQKKAIKRWNKEVGSVDYLDFRIYRDLNDKLKAMALSHHLSVNEFMMLIMNNYDRYITNKMENIMGRLIQNFDEFLKELKDNSIMDIESDKSYWELYLYKELLKMNITEPELCMNLEIKTLEAFETKTQEPHFSRFAVTGVMDDDVYDGGRYISGLFLI